MPFQDLLATVTIPAVTHLAEDEVVNTFAFGDMDTAQGDPPQIVMTALVNFYTVQDPTTLKTVSSFLGSQLSRSNNDVIVRVYDLTDHLNGSPHGSPIRSGPFTLAAPGGANNMPSEVACVLRLEGLGRATSQVQTGVAGIGGVTRPKQRHTGRVYIGPLNQSAVQDLSVAPRVSQQMRDTLLGRAKALNDAVKAANITGHLGVWSRKDAVIRDLESFAVDDAFDTQRRRGEKPTALTRLSA